MTMMTNLHERVEQLHNPRVHTTTEHNSVDIPPSSRQYTATANISPSTNSYSNVHLMGTL